MTARTTPLIGLEASIPVTAGSAGTLLSSWTARHPSAFINRMTLPTVGAPNPPGSSSGSTVPTTGQLWPRRGA